MQGPYDTSGAQSRPLLKGHHLLARVAQPSMVCEAAKEAMLAFQFKIERYLSCREDALHLECLWMHLDPCSTS